MKLAKSWFVFVMMVVFLCLAAWLVLAAEKAQVLKQAADKLEAVASESNLRELGDKLGEFKKAGLSYQPSLVVPVEGVISCKNDEQLRILLGMYSFDSHYALLFGRKEEFAAAIGLRNDIPARLNLKGKLKIRAFTPDELKRILDNPDNPANRDLYIKYAAATVHDMLEATKSDESMLPVFLDVAYGGVVESLYVASKLALAAGTGPKLVGVFNEEASRLDSAHQALAAYAGDPELDAIAKRSQRERVLMPIAETLKVKKGNLTEADVTKILSLIEPERSKVAGKCK